MTAIKARIRELSSQLTPRPTGVEPVLPRLEGVRAVLFDVYGTLLVSGSGDISLTSGASHGGAASAALAACGVDQPVDGDAVVARLKEIVRQTHASSASAFPEVEIRDVWRDVLVAMLPGGAAERVDIEQLAIEYECRVNPIGPMPGLRDTLDAIRQAGLKMGIVSNAQFFTPPAIETMAGAPLPELGLDSDLCVWSYEHGEAKPGRPLYDMAAERLATVGVASGQTLYVGNDMRNDIAPAAMVGFRTALFAGDARSLRLREGDPLVGDRCPDAVLTDLRQIPSILSLADGPERSTFCQ